MSHTNGSVGSSGWSKAELAVLAALVAYIAAAVIALVIWGGQGLVAWALFSTMLGGIWIMIIARGKPS